jgi:hypothetical protein
MNKFEPQFHTVLSHDKARSRTRWYERFVLRYDPKLFDGANCRGIDTEIFYPPKEKFDPSEERLFTRMCNNCPVQQACLEWGLAHERYGVWGGTTPPMRSRIRSKLGICIADPQHNP